MAMSREFLWGLVATVVVTVVAATSVPWWGKYVGWGTPDPAPSSAIAGMSGGCTTFTAIAQNRYPPYGAAIRTQPNLHSTQVGSYAGNKTISVNGWVHGTADYPTNPPPWNSNIWFHLADGAGWVSYAAVRAYPMTQGSIRMEGHRSLPPRPARVPCRDTQAFCYLFFDRANEPVLSARRHGVWTAARVRTPSCPPTFSPIRTSGP
jgi:hypothetical protein